jgi:hypothetical protein
MEDLIPFLIFLAIGAVNLLNFIAKKSKLSRSAEGNSAPPSQLERFFEQLSQQLNPQEPTELPDWPEGYERPDYLHEMEEFEEPQPEITPKPELRPEEIPTPAAKISRPPSSFNKANAFQINGKKGLRQAMLAHILFSPPRALDNSPQK